MGPKPCCATCRHYESSGTLKGTGWCRHPKHDRDDLVLVRGSELACKVVNWPGNGNWEEAKGRGFSSSLAEPRSEPLN